MEMATYKSNFKTYSECVELIIAAVTKALKGNKPSETEAAKAKRLEHACAFRQAAQLAAVVADKQLFQLPRQAKLLHVYTWMDASYALKEFLTNSLCVPPQALSSVALK